jgi:glucose-1-phosphate thymidylyltransferase
MRKPDGNSDLSDQQAKVADSGVKALIPIDRPFLDYVLTVVADAGYSKVCLVIGPEHRELQNYYEKLNTNRFTIDFVIQKEALGTADAVAAAKGWCAGEPFAVINSDNYYPLTALERLRAISAPGVALFEREAMLAGSNIPADRLEKFAIAELEGEFLSKVIEKPSFDAMAKAASQQGGRIYLSMNLWLFDTAIFDACEAIPKSPRGEFEITDAVQYAVTRLGSKYAAILVHAPVLDLSSRTDVGPVTSRLKGMKVNL